MSRKYWGGLLIGVTSLCLLLWLGNVLYGNIRQQHIMNAATLDAPESYAVQEAIMVYRKYAQPLRIQYIEPVSNGVLVLHRRFFKEGNFDINVEFMQWTWRGWKWTWGGGYGGGTGTETDGLFVEYFQKPDDYLRTATPFPMLYGAVTNNNIHSLRITDGADYTAEVRLIIDHHNHQDDQRSWFARVPQEAGRELTITGISTIGETVTEKKLLRYEFMTAEERSGSGTITFDD